MKRWVLILCLALPGMSLLAQGRNERPAKVLERVEEMLAEQSYKTAYERCETLLGHLLADDGRRYGDAYPQYLLRTAHYMERAMAGYREDADDSAGTRYRRILPRLETVERALCLMLLDSTQAALRDTALLKAVPVERARYLCTNTDSKGLNTTPTIYDLVLVQYLQAHPGQEGQRCRRALLAHHRRLLAGTRDNQTRRTEEALVIYHELRMAQEQTDMDKMAAALQCLDRCRGYRSEMLTTVYHYVAELYYDKGERARAKAYCDTAVKLNPKSEGGVACSELQGRIIAPSIAFQELREAPADEEDLFSVAVRNVATLYYRVVRMPENWSRERDKASLLQAEVIYENELPIGLRDDFKDHMAIALLPALPVGDYVLMASHRRDGFAGSAGFNCLSFRRTDIRLLCQYYHCASDRVSGYVLHIADGSPAPGLRVTLLNGEYKDHRFEYTTLDSALTDSLGRYRLSGRGQPSTTVFVSVTSQGLEHRQAVYFRHDRKRPADDTMIHVFFDRPIYRPGDTVHFALIESCKHHGGVAHVLDGNADVPVRSIRVVMKDFRRQTVDSLAVATDRFGSASGWFVVPEEAQSGMYWMSFEDGRVMHRESITVEAYKQPTFTVTLKEKGPVAGFGDTVRVEGLAQTYTEAPVDNVTVMYSVTRHPDYVWWRRNNWASYAEPVVVASGTSTTDADGRFSIAFVPQPCMDDPRNSLMAYRYEVSALVTDAAGETQTKTHSITVGYENRLLGITAVGMGLDTLQYRFCDRNDNPLPGTLTLRIERLQQPREAKLLHPAMLSGATPHMSREEFARRFPQYYYSLQEFADTCWPVTGRPITLTVPADSTSPYGINKIGLPKLRAGVFRLILSVDSLADTMICTHVPPESVKPQGVDLLWAATDKATYRVGETVTLRVASRHKNLHCIMLMTVGDSIAEERLLTLNDNVQSLRFTVTREMVYRHPIILLFALKEGQSQQIDKDLFIPAWEKQLKVSVETFRNYLEPGATERWDITVTGQGGTPGARTSPSSRQPVAMIMTMYDKALDSYANSRQGWGFNPLPYWPYNAHRHFQQDIYTGYYKQWIVGPSVAGYSGTGVYEWTPWRYQIEEYVFCRAGAGLGARKSLSAGNTAPRSAVAGMHLMEVDEAEEEADPLSGNADVPVRRCSTGTLAFFEPSLRFDSTGHLHYTFRVPDLLTRWRLEGLAWTPDVAFGRLQKTLVTRKQLMVQPNMPRYVRLGDTLMLSARVSNLTDETLDVAVVFSLENMPGSADVPVRKDLAIPPRSTSPVSFPIILGARTSSSAPAPRPHPDSLVCRIVATAQGHSDGVQLALPVLSNRMTVTQSHALYKNGTGGRNYNLALYSSPTAEPVAITVEYTSNPVWLALQAMPHLAECANPSNIYLFNSVYCHVIGRAFANRFDTPFNASCPTPDTLLSRTLIANQLPDGGWGWMPQGGNSSDFVTRYILKGYGRMLTRYNLCISGFDYVRAVRYIDSMASVRYAEALKDKSDNTMTATDLDYLYTRSFYPGETCQKDFGKAYAYFYQNARKRYKEAAGLYEQALLALVLQRGGDRKEARELVRRLKEKSLVTDEAGMYWRDNRAGWLWNQRPVETQALLIQVLREVTPEDIESIARMRQWLLKQKQTTRWDSDIATVHAITALLDGNGTGGRTETHLSFPKINTTMTTSDTASGHVSRTWTGDTLAVLTQDSTLSLFLRRIGKERISEHCPAWGAVFYQYKEDMDKIPGTSTGITCESALYVVRPDGTLKPASDTVLRVGMRLRRVLTFTTDRVMEYVEVVDPRAACLEPVSTASGWRTTVFRQRSGMAQYYLLVGDKSTNGYISRLEKGRYHIESDCHITHAGTFTLAPAVLQCLYAPEYRATTPAERITVIQ